MSNLLMATTNTALATYPITVEPVVSHLLRSDAPVSLSTSGGKDSAAMALATNAYLDEIGHRGPRLLIHADLGRVEWRASLPMCQRLAERLNLPLVVVRRQAGDLLDRWRVRWRTNCERYANLETVRLILPWSTASMLFCRSELKAAIICRELVQRFPGQVIVSGVGIRREESTTRANAPIWAPESRLTNKTHQTSGGNWNPIAPWSLEQVLAYHQLRQFPLHEAYTRYGMSRVSCAYCVLAGLADLVASTTCPDNQDLYRDLVGIEVISTFSFQESRWLGDIAPHLLSEETREGLEEAKRRAAYREAAEARIPKHLLYSKGWPTGMPTRAEATLLSEVRQAIAQVVEIEVRYTTPDAILDRYAELIAAHEAREARKEAA